MKAIVDVLYFRSITLIILFIISIGCSKDDELTQINNDGSGGISCKVNGNVLTSMSKKDNFCKFEVLKNGVTTFQVGYSRDKHSNDFSFEMINIVAYNINFEKLEGTTFVLKNKANQESYGNYIKVEGFENNFSTNSTVNGELEILYYDKINKTIAGIFWFDSINKDGDYKKIRDGRFDLFVD